MGGTQRRLDFSGGEEPVIESRSKRRSAFLPLTLAISILSVGAAGYVATAGAPEFSRPATSLPDVVFALPATAGAAVAMAPHSTVDLGSAVEESAVVLTETAETVGTAVSVGFSSTASVSAASSGAAVQVLSSPPPAPPVVPTVAALPYVAPAQLSAPVVAPSTNAAVQATPAPGQRLATLITATPSPTQPAPSRSSGQNGRGAPAPIKAKADGGGSEGEKKDRRVSPDGD